MTCQWQGGAADATIYTAVTRAGEHVGATGNIASLAGTSQITGLLPFTEYTLVPVQQFPTSFLRLASVTFTTQSLDDFGAIRPESVSDDAQSFGFA